MPEILNKSLYDATFNIAKELFESRMWDPAYQSVIKFVKLSHGQYLYRYSNAKFSNGTFEGALKIWSPVEKDTGNRWTGFGLGGPGGQVGLYTTLEAEKCQNTLFAELFHYLTAEKNSSDNVEIHYDDFAETVKKHNESVEKGEHLDEDGQPKPRPAPERVSHKALKLHYMFAFTLEKPVNLIDLQLPVTPEDPNSFVAEVFRVGSKKYPNLFTISPNCMDLYMHGADASFCRAIGNACLGMVEVDGLLVTSARDTRSTSVILKGPVGKQFDFLKFAGRSSFFINPDGKFDEPAETLADQMYNDKHFNVEIHPVVTMKSFAKKLVIRNTIMSAINNNNTDN